MRCFVALSLPRDAILALSALAGLIRPRWPDISWARSEGYHLTLAFLGEVDERGVDCAAAALGKLEGKTIVFRFSGLGGFPPAGPWRVLYVRIDDQVEKNPGRAPDSGAARLDAGRSDAARSGTRPSPLRSIYDSCNRLLASEAADRGLGRLNAEWRPEGGGRPFEPHITLARMLVSRGGRRAWLPRERGARAERGGPLVPNERELAVLEPEIAASLAGQWTISRCSLYKSELGRGGAVYTELFGTELFGTELRPEGESR